jgi:alkyl hydroperoxide reductase subunit AhpC
MLHTVQLGQAARRIEELGVAMLVIGPGDAGQAKWHARLIRAPFPVAGDPVRAIYEAYGLVRGAWTLQRSGTFLVDRDGVLRLMRRSTNPAGALDMTELMNAIAALTPQ